MNFIVLNEKQGVNLDLVTNWEFGKAIHPDKRFNMNFKEAEEQGFIVDQLTLYYSVVIDEQPIWTQFIEEEARVLYRYLTTHSICLTTRQEEQK